MLLHEEIKVWFILLQFYFSSNFYSLEKQINGFHCDIYMHVCTLS